MSTSQKHSGSGHNIGGNLVQNISCKVSVEDIEKPIHQFLEQIRHHKFNDAKSALEFLRSTKNLETDAEGLIDVISIHLHIKDGGLKNDAYKKLNNLINSTSNSVCTDICQAILIKLDVFRNRTSDAIERSEGIENPGVYTTEVIYEHLCNDKTLSDAYENRKLNLSEAELCGLIRGAVRLKSSQVCILAAKFLKETHPSFNSDILDIESKIVSFNQKIDTGYWLITSVLRDELLLICDLVLQLSNEPTNGDSRLVRIALGLHQYTVEENKSIGDFCLKNIDVIRSFDSEAADLININDNDSVDNLSSPQHRIHKSLQNNSFKKQTVDHISNLDHLTDEDYMIMKNIASSDELKSLSNKKISVNNSDKFVHDYIQYDLLLYAIDILDIDSVNRVKAKTETFISQYRDNISSLQPISLLRILERLTYLNLYELTIDILEVIIPTTDLWPSPFIKCYLDSLLKTERWETLNATIEKIEKEQWDSFTWRIRTEQQYLSHDVAGAIDSAKNLVEYSPSIEHYNFLLHMYGEGQSRITEKQDLIDTIPDSLLLEPSDHGYVLLAGMMCDGRSERAQKFLIEWFVSNPEKYSKSTSNAFLPWIISPNEQGVTSVCDKTDNCLGGVVYSIDDKRAEKLIVSDSTPDSSYLLRTSSPLARLLLSMSVGDVKQHGIQEVKLLERKPASSSVFHIATSLRQLMNDGTDQFYSFEISDNPELALETLKKKLLMMGNHGVEEIFNNPDIPLYFKSKLDTPHSPIHAALACLWSKTTTKTPLPNFGEEFNNRVILDIYAIVYLSLIGFSKVIASNTEILITTETESIIKEWLEEVSRVDYLTLGVDDHGNLVRTTYEDIKRSTAQLQEDIQLVLEVSEVTNPSLLDVSKEVMQIREYIDPSTYSSIKLSMTSRASWLCIDYEMARLIAPLSCKTVNAANFLSAFGSNLSSVERERGIYQHAASKVPFPLTFDDLIHLSNSNDECADYFLAEIIKTYPSFFDETDKEIAFYGLLLSNILLKAASSGNLKYGLKAYDPRNNSFVERIFYAIFSSLIHHKSEVAAERKIALLLYLLIDSFHGFELMQSTILVLISSFITGHFLSFEETNRNLKDIFNERHNKKT